MPFSNKDKRQWLKLIPVQRISFAKDTAGIFEDKLGILLKKFGMCEAPAKGMRLQIEMCE